MKVTTSGRAARWGIPNRMERDAAPNYLRADGWHTPGAPKHSLLAATGDDLKVIPELMLYSNISTA